MPFSVGDVSDTTVTLSLVDCVSLAIGDRCLVALGK
jgi:hypothetical protein